jgi:hypothetical protein
MRPYLLALTTILVLAGCRPFYRDAAPPDRTGAEPSDAGTAHESGASFVEPVDAGSLPELPDATTPRSADGIFRVDEPTRGTVPSAAVKQRVAGALPAITACYDRALPRRPGLHGNLLIEFVIAADGSVPHASARPVDQALDDDDVVACVVAEFRKLSFPKPSGDRAVVSHPLRFEPPPSDAGADGR